MMKKMKGFTLAEVLTTLMVIGVVAALTIPALMNNTGDRQYKAQYKKALSVLENAISMINTGDYKCTISNSEDLAKCFNNEMKGNRVDSEGKTVRSKSVIVSPDGAAYQFLYGGDTGKTSLKDACGTAPAQQSREASGRCLVVVDLNGLSKGTTEFGSDELIGSGVMVASDLLDNDAMDQQVIVLYSNGAEPAYDDRGSNINRGYHWVYGDDAEP